MRNFFWHGAEIDGTRGQALVKWSTICQPMAEGGLGVKNLRHTNMTLLMKWVRRLMQAPLDMATQVLMDNYGRVLYWGQRSEHRRGQSTFYKGLRPVFSQAHRMFHAKLGDGAHFRFWSDDWSGPGPLRDVFPQLFGLSVAPEATVQQAWCYGWCPSLVDAMSDQRLEDLLRMQTTLAHLRPDEVVGGAWEWRGSRFSARGVYKLLLDAKPTEDLDVVRRCCLLWRCRIQLKIKIFGWLLIRGLLMTRALRQRYVPEADASCVMCSSMFEDCTHLFFECPLVQPMWAAAALDGLDTTSADAFWRSLCQGPFRREVEWRTIFATLWAIWLHRNEIIFRGRLPSTDAVQYDARWIAQYWHLGVNNHAVTDPQYRSFLQ